LEGAMDLSQDRLQNGWITNAIHFPPTTRRAQIALHRVSQNVLNAEEDLRNIK
jgi:hypothetical protein